MKNSYSNPISINRLERLFLNIVRVATSRILFLATALVMCSGCISTIVGETLSLTTTVVAEAVALPIKVTAAVIEASSDNDEEKQSEDD